MKQEDKHFSKIMKVTPGRNTYVNHPNKSAEILAKRHDPESKMIALSKENPRPRNAVQGLSGPLKNDVENFHPFTDHDAVKKLKQMRAKREALNKKANGDETGRGHDGAISGRGSKPVDIKYHGTNKSMFPDFAEPVEGPAKRNGRPEREIDEDDPPKKVPEMEIKCLDDLEENATERSEKERVFFRGADPHNMIAPLTGNSLITLRYMPELHKFRYKREGVEEEENLLKMGKIKFIHKDEKISIPRNHYWPIFFASSADELRDADDGKVRK